MKTLYPYQLTTVEKFFPRQYALEGSEMGTGKTLVAIELARRWRDKTYEKTGKLLPILVVTPINTFQSWIEKIEEQQPQWNIMLVDRKNRTPFVEAMNKCDTDIDIFVCHWELLRFIINDINNVLFSAVVADECHKASNRNAQQTKALKKIKTYHKLGLSGTASGDKPWNLWSILNWLDRKKFSSYWAFVKKYVEYETRQTYSYKFVDGKRKTIVTDYKQLIAVKNEKELHAIIRPFYVRHLKSRQCCKDHPHGVMPFLPHKIYKKLHVEITGEQLRLYKEMRKNMVAWVGENRDEPLVAPIVLAKMLRLNQFTLATPVLEEDNVVGLRAPSAKLDALIDLVSTYDSTKFLVFTSSKKMADLTVSELNKLGIKSVALTGDTTAQDRLKLVKDFNSNKYRIVVASIPASAEGIDGLQTTCDTAVFLDRHLSSFKNAQAEDRLHRGGQKNPVTIIDIVASNVEIDMEKLQALNMKWDNVMKILGSGK